MNDSYIQSCTMGNTISTTLLEKRPMNPSSTAIVPCFLRLSNFNFAIENYIPGRMPTE